MLHAHLSFKKGHYVRAQDSVHKSRGQSQERLYNELSRFRFDVERGRRLQYSTNDLIMTSGLVATRPLRDSSDYVTRSCAENSAN